MDKDREHLLVDAKNQLERKTEELAQSLAVLRATLESTTDAILVIDEQRNIADWNSKFAEIWRLPLSLLESGQEARLLDFVAPQTRDPEAFLNRIREIYLSAAEDSFDLVELSDGRRLERYSRLQRVQSRRVGRVWSFRDVTVRKHTEDELRNERERLRLALDAGRLGTWSWDPQTDLVTFDARAAEIFDVSRTAVITWKGLRELLFVDDRERARLAVEEAIRAQADYQIEYRLVRKSGEQIWVAANGRANYSSSGTVIGMTGVVQDVTDAKRIEEVHSRLAAVVESSDDAIVSKTLDGVIRTWNTGAQRIFGYSPEEVIGKPVSILIPPDRINEEPGILDRLKNGERINHYETVRRRKDGTLIDVSITVSPVKDASGRIVGASKIARDITGRRRAEIDLKRNEEQLRLITDATPGLIAYIGSDYRYSFVNQQYEIWFASPRGEIIGKHVEEILGKEAFRQLEPHMARAFLGEHVHFEMEIPYRLAGQRFVDVFYIPDLDANNRVRGIYVRVIDITHRKEIEDALRDETRVLELLNDTGTAIASKLDLDSLVQTVTDSATKLSGAAFGAFFYNVIKSDGEILLLCASCGASQEAFAGVGLPRDTPLFNATFHEHTIVRSDDVTQDPRSGSPSPSPSASSDSLAVRSYLAVPVISRSGEVIGGLFFGHPEPGVFTEKSERLIAGVAAQAAVAIDNARLYEAAQSEIAQRKQTEDALAAARDSAQAANRAKDQFLAALSHELRTPLTPVLALLSSKREEAALPDSLTRDLETIRRNVELEARLIDDLLDLSRITSGKLELHRSRVTIKQLIQDALDTCLADLQTKTLRVVQNIPEPAPVLEVDRARVTQVLWNLLKNSIKFTPNGGTITVRVKKDTARIQVEVEDTGMGISGEEIDRIFDAFEQANRRVTQQFGGLGLGLAISRAIVEAHEGTITAFSAGAGLGSTFTLSLPRGTRVPKGADDAYSLPPVPVPDIVADSRPLRILLVEDHADTASVLIRLLQRMGHEVIHAASVTEALRQSALITPEGSLDLVISDLGLPDASGLDLMRELSTRYQLPGIALSGFGMDSDLKESAAAGFSHHLIKPVDIASLRRAIGAIAPKTKEK